MRISTYAIRGRLRRTSCYAIGIGTRAGAPVNTRLLEDLTKEGGGYVESLRNPSDILAAVARICDDLQSQYILAFEPAHADGKYGTDPASVRRRSVFQQLASLSLS